MFQIDLDFAYDGANEPHEIVEFERDYGVKAEIIGRANGWPVLRVRSSDRKILETILDDRDEAHRAGEILADAADSDDYRDGTAMYGNHAII